MGLDVLRSRTVIKLALVIPTTPNERKINTRTCAVMNYIFLLTCIHNFCYNFFNQQKL